MHATPRKRLFIDPKVQGILLLRIVLYWFLCTVTVSLMLLCWNAAQWSVAPLVDHASGDRLWAEYGSVALAALLLLPVLLADAILTSNRFAGPLYRVRRSMRELAAGSEVKPIQFRENDLWQEVAKEFNAVLAYVEELKNERAAAQAGRHDIDQEQFEASAST